MIIFWSAPVLLMLGAWFNQLMSRPKKQPKKQEPEQRRLVYVYHQELPDDIFAIVRLTWYRDKMVSSVDEIALIKEDELYEGFADVLRQALDAGADISLKTSLDAELLGIEELQ